jgi:hypothetical protein
VNGPLTVAVIVCAAIAERESLLRDCVGSLFRRHARA